MSTFMENQERTRGQMKEALGGMFPFGQFEELTKQNMAMFENALGMFNPGAMNHRPTEPATPPEPPEPKPSPNPAMDPLKAMQNQLDLMQKQLRAMSGGKPDDNG